MMQKLIYLILVLVFSILVVAMLFVLSDDVVHNRNPFLREFPPHVLAEGDTLDLGFSSYYIAGATDHFIYLGNPTAPFHVLQTDVHLLDTQHAYIRALDYRDMKFWALRVKVDSPYFYLADGAVPVIFKGHLSNWVGENQPFDSAYFTDFVPMSENELTIRSISAATNEYVLAKERLDRNSVTLFQGLLQKQLDGRFCVDGMLHFQREHKRLVYVYYYRNQYIVADNNLALSYRGNTIDTVSKARLKFATVTSKGTRTLSAPPLFVNKYSSLRNNQLFINSGLLAMNEDRKVFDRSSVFDVYNLNARSYQFSFYIPELNGEKLHDVCFTKDYMFVLTGKYLISYKLNRRFFP